MHHQTLPQPLEITSRQPSATGQGLWLEGSVHGFVFEALCYPQDPGSGEAPLGHSRVYRLALVFPGEASWAAHYRGGWDVEPATPAAHAAVEALALGLTGVLLGR